MIISTTKFKLKKLSLYGHFFIDTYRVVKQVKKSGGAVHMKKSKSFGEITSVTWESDVIPTWQEAIVRLQRTGSAYHCSGPA